MANMFGLSSSAAGQAAGASANEAVAAAGQEAASGLTFGGPTSATNMLGANPGANAAEAVTKPSALEQRQGAGSQRRESMVGKGQMKQRAQQDNLKAEGFMAGLIDKGFNKELTFGDIGLQQQLEGMFGPDIASVISRIPVGQSTGGGRRRLEALQSQTLAPSGFGDLLSL